MNYKLLLPTYRNRYVFVKNTLEELAQKHRFKQGLSLGTGEGDYDRMLAQYCDQLTACDINEADVAFAKKLNSDVANIEYRVENALELSFADDSFDLLISVEVIEHVGQPARMMEEIGRVLKPGGVAIITFPSVDFPFTYDPINRILAGVNGKKISQGAYAFGHEYLIDQREFRKWVRKEALVALKDRNLSGYLVGLVEMYWTGMIQSLLKANSDNLPGQEEKKISLRPTTKEPILASVTDALLWLDQSLFGKASHSVGKGFLLQKEA
ncbi:MAG: class I SAM-dependent methyltransferase, partial [Bacteroidota bacterium]